MSVCVVDVMTRLNGGKGIARCVLWRMAGEIVYNFAVGAGADVDVDLILTLD